MKTIYYRPQRIRNMYKKTDELFKISRSKIELFINCPKCFYLDRKLGIGRPDMFPYTLNIAVDTLLKKEFDIYREKGEAHPLMKKYKIKAVPFKHERLDEWRDGLHYGCTYKFPKTNLLITGAIDDLWIKRSKELIIADYKATSKKDEVTLDADWQSSYKRQMEIYQWLFRKNGFKVSNKGYFVYSNGIKSKRKFSDKLHFDTKVIEYVGNTRWIVGVIRELYKCLQSNRVPKPSYDCDYCQYNDALNGKVK